MSADLLIVVMVVSTEPGTLTSDAWVSDSVVVLTKSAEEKSTCIYWVTLSHKCGSCSHAGTLDLINSCVSDESKPYMNSSAELTSAFDDYSECVTE